MSNSLCKHLDARNFSLHKIYIKVEITMVHFFQDYLLDDRTESFRVTDETGFRIGLSGDRYVQGIIVSMSVRVGTLAEDLKVLLIRSLRTKELVSSVEALDAGYLYHY